MPLYGRHMPGSIPCYNSSTQAEAQKINSEAHQASSRDESEE